MTGGPGRAGPGLPVLLTIAPRSDPHTFPLGPSLAQLGEHYEVLIVLLEGSVWNGDEEVLASLSEIEPAAALRFALPAWQELTTLVKPRALELTIDRRPEREIVFVDAGCFVNEAPLFTTGMDDAFLELISAFSQDGSSADVLRPRMGAPTGDLLRMSPLETARPLLHQWRRRLEEAYVTRPDISLASAEAAFLGALPALDPGVRWNHERAYASWWDLPPKAEFPRVVGSGALEDYFEEAGPAHELMERRVHGGSPLEWILERREDLGPAPPEMTYASGEPVQRLARDLFRAIDPWGRRWEDPWDDLIRGSFKEWMHDADERGLPRFAQALYWARPDLQASFPPRTTGVEAFTTWLAAAGVGMGRVELRRALPFPARAKRAALRRARRLLRHGEPTLCAPRRPSHVSNEVNVVGFLTAETGLGQAVRGTARAVRQAGFPLALLDLSNRTYARRHPFPLRSDAWGTPFDVSVYQINPRELLDYRSDSLAYRFSASWHIGFFVWETDRIPREWLPALDMVDEIWVPSRFVAGLFREETAKPLVVMGHPVEPPETLEANRRRFGLPEHDLMVGFMADAYSDLERKNPLGAIDAFTRAFGPGFEGVHLALKLSNLDNFSAYRSRVLQAIDGKPVTLIADYLSPARVWELLACFDVYLSLHRCEGFGLTILEAMALGIPCVATAYGGNLDFMDASDSLPVPHRLVEIPNDLYGIYRGAGRWADPDTEQAADHLRRLAEDGALRGRISEAGRRRARQWLPERYTERVKQALERIGLT